MAALPLADGSLWYDENGGSGQPLVFVHGGWMNGDAWTNQIEQFADEYRVITLDLRGHGRTGATDARRYSVELFADDLEDLLDHLDAEDPILCGLSLGNMVTQEYLARHPDRPAAAVLGGPVRSLRPFGLPTGLESVLSPVTGIQTALAMFGSRATYRSLLRSIRATTGQAWISVDPETRARAVDLAGEVSRTEFRKIFRALYRYDPPDLTDVSTPVLAIYGEGEADLIKQDGRRLVESIDSATLESVPEAAHLVNIDNPGGFNERVADFLTDVAAAPA